MSAIIFALFIKSKLSAQPKGDIPVLKVVYVFVRWLIYAQSPQQTKNDRDWKFGTHFPKSYLKNCCYFKKKRPQASLISKNCQVTKIFPYLFDCLVMKFPRLKNPVFIEFLFFIRNVGKRN